MNTQEEEVLGIIQSLEAQVDRSPTWRMVYRSFAGDDFSLRSILTALIAQGKITETIVAANTEYHIKKGKIL